MSCFTIINPLGASGSAKYPITSSYGPRVSPTAGASTFHKGIDLGAPAGTRINAVAPGTVITSTWDTGGGNIVIIKHPTGVYTAYMHMRAPGVPVGTVVNTGDKIGEVGSTGHSTGPHLHFEMRNAQYQAFDPAPCYANAILTWPGADVPPPEPPPVVAVTPGTSPPDTFSTGISSNQILLIGGGLTLAAIFAIVLLDQDKQKSPAYY